MALAIPEDYQSRCKIYLVAEGRVTNSKSENDPALHEFEGEVLAWNGVGVRRVEQLSRI